MKRIIILITILLAGIQNNYSQEYLKMMESETYTVQEIIDNGEAYFAERDQGKGSGYVQFKRWEYNAKRLMNEAGYLPKTEAVLAEIENYNAYLNTSSATRQSLTDNWDELGPQDWNATTSWNPGVGRITGIAIDQNNSDHMIVGANTGGVWKTIDGGENWMPLGDYFSNLRVYSVTIHPTNSNHYFFGSTNGLIYHSLDAGATWNLLGDMGSSSVNKILIHPTDPSIVFATSQNGGIRKSSDGGLNWVAAVTDSQGYDIEFKPNNPNVVYATGTNFHVSYNGGESFSTNVTFESAPKMIGISPNDENVIYVLEASGGSFGGIYKSVNAGFTFSELDHEGRNYFGYDTAGFDSGGQAPRDMDIAVNPEDANEVHIAGVLTWKSTDGGENFSCTSDWVPGNAENANIGYCHADVDLLLFNGTTLFAGTDGGIFKAEDTANVTAEYYEDLTAGLGIRQLYKIGITQTPEVIITAGSQDNGSSFYSEAEGWKDWIGADGMEGFIDKDNSSKMFGMIQFGGVYRTFNGGQTTSGISTPSQGNWVTPFEQDPMLTDVIYIGLNRVYKSVASGNNWTAISQELGGNLNQLKIANSNNLFIYASRGGLLFKTEDGGATDWLQLPSPGGSINSIAIHPTNPEKIAVATTSNSKVFVSEDGGLSWLNYKFNLPGFSSLALVWDNNGEDGLYLGMDYGIFYIDNTFNEWQPYSTNLPNVIINELEINSVDGKIYAGTYGRGLWASPYVPHLLNTTSLLNDTDVEIFPNPVKNSVTINFRKGAEADFRIYDQLGKLVRYQPNVSISQPYSIDISELNSGIYFIRINSDIGTITKRLIKK
ncbi:MAG: T9SS type A sorting domain-containing protein [Flavobacteriales bacterium]|nr:MAG: T9SS type A sorting domain-containing protein [Flavobacteriales bacterium]